MHELEGRVAVVTGAGVGIGLAIVQRLRAAGVRVWAGDLRVTDALREAVGAEGAVIEGDLGVAGGPEALVAAAVRGAGQLDLLVNNLGASPVRGGFLETSDADWATLLDVNLLSMVRATRAAIPHLLETRGAVVTVSSVLAREPLPHQPDYCATKAALVNLTKTLSKEFGPRGVRFVCVSPGATLTPQWTIPGGQLEQYAARAGCTPEEARDHAIPEALRIDLRRLVRPEEVAETVAFAAGPGASAITGSEIVVDAGMRDGW